MEATPVKNVYIGTPVTDGDGGNWLVFQYTTDDKDPWKWPKVMKCNGHFYKWMSWNSDKNTVNYKECRESELAYPVK